jgi:hypothetical protein
LKKISSIFVVTILLIPIIIFSTKHINAESKKQNNGEFITVTLFDKLSINICSVKRKEVPPLYVSIEAKGIKGRRNEIRELPKNEIFTVLF